MKSPGGFGLETATVVRGFGELAGPNRRALDRVIRGLGVMLILLGLGLVPSQAESVRSLRTLEEELFE